MDPAEIEKTRRDALGLALFGLLQPLLELDEALHARVSAFYSSKQPRIIGSKVIVREWLSTQSYEAQRDFGLIAIENIRKGIW